MGLEIDSLYWKARLELSQLDRDIATAKGKFSGMSDSIQKETSVMKNVIAGIGGVLAATFSIAAIGSFIKSIIQVRGEFQKYEAVLTNTLGSGSKAQAALKNIQEFAAVTPFQITELTSSFVKLANQGFTPTIEEMRKMGDLASAVGKGFDQLTEAILDAAMGQWERMKEFGIKAKQEGDKVTVTFKGQATTIDNTAESIRNYILSLGDMKGVSGSMASISETLVGKISNMQDAWSALLNTLGKKSEGAFSIAIGWISALIKGIDAANKKLADLRGETITANVQYNVDQDVKTIKDQTDRYVKLGETAADAQKKAIEFVVKELKLQIFQYENRLKPLFDQILKFETEHLAYGYTMKEGKHLAGMKSTYELTKAKIDGLKAELEMVLETFKEEPVVTTGTKTGKKVTPEEAYIQELKFFGDYLSSMKKQYQEIEDWKKAYGEKSARETYENYYDSYKEFLIKTYHLAKQAGDREQLGMIGTAWGQVSKVSIEQGERDIITEASVNKAKEMLKVKSKELIINEDIVKKMRQHADLTKKSADELRELVNQLIRKRNFISILQDAESVASKIAQDFSGINDGISVTADNIAKMIHSIENVTTDIGLIGSASATSSEKIFATVDIISNIGSKIGQLINEIKTMNQLGDQRRLQAAFDAIAFTLDKINRSLDADKIQGYAESLEQIRKAGLSLSKDFEKLTFAEIEAAILKYENLVAKENAWNDRNIEKAILRDWEAILELKQQQYEIEKDMRELLTGTTSEAISDTITKGFEDGLDSIEDFGKSMNDIIKKALIDAFQAKYIDEQVEKWYEAFYKRAEGGLTPEEIALSKIEWDKMTEAQRIAWEETQKMISGLGITAEAVTTKGMAGAIKGITEDTAGLIAGQFGAIRINVLEQLEVAKQGLMYQKETAINTRALSQLREMKDYLRSMAGNSVLVGRSTGR